MTEPELHNGLQSDQGVMLIRPRPIANAARPCGKGG